MDFCTNCGEKVNGGLCSHCGSRMTKAEIDMTSAPKTRIEKRKGRSKTKRLVAGIGGLLVILCVTLIMVHFNKHESKTDLAVTKTLNQSESNSLKNNRKTSNMNTPTEKHNVESSNLPSADYIFPDSGKKELSEEDIAALTKGQLRLARNEIYARHGYVFKSADLQKYFSSKSWYHADPTYDGSLNEVEQKNVKLLEAREARLE